MQAAVIREHGDVDRVLIEEVPDPAPKPGEVVLRVHAAACNHLDLWVIRGGRGPALSGPHILGSDAAGVVEEVGPGVEGVREGDEVLVNPGLSCGQCEFCRRGEQSECVAFGILEMSRPGTFAERVAVPARCVHRKPEHLDFTEAAALPLAHVTAWRMLMTRAGLRPGESVLIHGIGGGVAIAALQLARLAGARVIATTSTAEKMRRARDLGAAHVVNYTKEDVAAAVRDLTGGRGVDVAVDTVGAATWPLDFSSVRRGGRIVLCGVTTGDEATTPLRTLYWNQLTVIGSTMGSEEDFRRMLEAVVATRLKPVIGAVEPLARAREALTQLNLGRQFGKVVLRIA